MLTNYFKSALRFIKHNKVFAGINLLGLSIALAASFIMLLFVINELSYNRCHKNSKRVYRVLNYYVDFKNTQSGTPYVLATALKDEFPQVEKAVKTRYMRGLSLKLKDQSVIAVNDAIATDSDIFNIFTLPLISGLSSENLLDELNSIVLSRSLAEKVLPGQNPIGQEIVGMVNNTEQLFMVTGVFEDLPQNSTLRTQCLVNSRWTIEPINKIFGITNADVNYSMNFWNTWVLLSKDCNVKTIENQFRAFEVKNISEKPTYQYSLQNLGDVYLGSADVANAGITGNIKNVRLFSAIAFLIVLVAAINYIILSTAVSTGRRLEIGIRKTFGAINRSIKNQLLSESVIMALIVLPVALVLMRIALPYAGKVFQTELSIISSNIGIYISVYLVLTIIIGVVSGLYTSSYLSGLKVMDILKSTSQTGKKKQFFRSILIVLQLVIFCSFVSGTLIIRSQYKYALNKDLGYYNRDILLIDLGRDFKGYSAYINSIKSNPNVIMAGGVMDGLPMQGSMATMYPHFQDKTLKVKVEGLAVDYDFVQTMGIKILEGREFSQDFGSDLKQSVMLNETAVKELGITDPIGKLIGNQTIIGIVKNFNLHSIHSDIPPLIMNMTDKYIQQVAVHYKPGTMAGILPMLEAEWKKAAPDRPFRYTTIEDLNKSIYSSERNLSTIVSIFALFTLLIAAFGLFGLTLFVARSRIKEIGIKKAFGSSGQSIIYSFLKNNLILVIAAALLSVPVTFYVMTRWLNNFAFKVSISWWVFVFSFAVAALVVLATVYFHSYKASRINPADALRHE
ncbi:MAG TPA: ABC transporter permease [Bacteroidales bacterium]|nr:ABC transporter permease [Bacteroidales bacterium]